MVITLLLVTFCVSFIVAAIVVRIFNKSIKDMLNKILGSEISSAWARYIFFAMYVSALTNGVRIWEIEKYLPLYSENGYKPQILDFNKWTFELARSVLAALEGLTTVLSSFFIIALLALVIIRFIESKILKSKLNSQAPEPENNK